MMRMFVSMIFLFVSSGVGSALPLAAVQQLAGADQLASAQQQALVREVQQVLLQDRLPDDAQRQRFWRLLDQLPDASRTSLRQQVELLDIAYSRAWLGDAQSARMQGVAYKSGQRRTLEQRLKRQGILTQWTLDAYDEQLRDLAGGDSVRFLGKSLGSVDQVTQLLQTLEQADRRIERLFRRPAGMRESEAQAGPCVLEGLQGQVRGLRDMLDASLDLHVEFRRNPAEGCAELRQQRAFVEQLVRTQLMRWRTDQLQSSPSRLGRDLLRDLRGMLHRETPGQVSIRNLDMETED